MKIINLIENTIGNPNCINEHGLSFYIETNNHHILFDTGASGAIIKNAQVLNIPLSKVDTVILSHGHYDHSGGILPFTKINQQAKIYLHQLACGDYYSINNHQSKYIGIDKKIITLPQVIWTNDYYQIDKQLILFSKLQGPHLIFDANKRIKMQVAGKLLPDTFEHEQCLVVKDKQQSYLFSGCGHSGIVNILKRYYSLFEQYPDVVISGFHMAKKTEYTKNDIMMIEKTARMLVKLPTIFYSGHCTGQFAFDIMKNIMQDKLIQLHTGMIIK